MTFVYAQPASAYVPWGWFFNSAIDANGDGSAFLTVCFDSSKGGPIYVNRGQIAEELEQWHQASVGTFWSNGVCDNDGSNIQILWANLTWCVNPEPTVAGGTQNLGNIGYSHIQVFLNTQCTASYDWNDADGIANNRLSALATALHEVGHTLGLKHSNLANAVMSDGGPDNCALWGVDWLLAFDDADGYRDRYPGIADTAVEFNGNAICQN